jgi:predicted nucleotide-binding protein
LTAVRIDKKYSKVRFEPSTVNEGFRTLSALGSCDEERFDGTIESRRETRHYSKIEEFLADLKREFSHSDNWQAELKITDKKAKCSRYLTIWWLGTWTNVKVDAVDRVELEKVFQVFDSAEPEARIPDPPEPRPTIFIGHGQSPQWRDLKDHLHEKHGYAIEAYEIGARAGHTIRDILDRMAAKSTFALLVMTGEDDGPRGEKRARQNVIHEAGLFQGRLGFDRAIILLEEGTEEFSNIHGVQQIRFKNGNIRETFGDVLATLRREFPV